VCVCVCVCVFVCVCHIMCAGLVESGSGGCCSQKSSHTHTHTHTHTSWKVEESEGVEGDAARTKLGFSKKK
jgi:hypothetical protein